MESHPLRMRGLKPTARSTRNSGCVASFTDAWIETVVPKAVVDKVYVASFTDAWIET